MICKNCGANIRNRENYCPNCGMELMVSYSKSLKEKYIAGEYRDHRDDLIIKNRNNQKNQKEEFEPVKGSNETEDYYGNEILEEYETGESGSSALFAIILFLVVALLFGFVLGMILFSGSLHSLPGFSNITL
ncbi:MAG TPA: zinc-ribbon domain-containing protein [Methanobacterium sp.]